jgi:RNA polymerase sigma-70 factor (ECF subfamily)
MNVAGLKAVFVQERAMLLRLFAARLGNAAEAEDALQDLWIRLESVSPGPISDPVPYLYRMAMNLALDRRLSAQRRGDRERAWSEVQPSASEIPDAERVLVMRDRLARVEAAMAAMPERARTALRLYRIEELSQREIAAEMGVTVSAVEKLLRRALRQISEAGRKIDIADVLPKGGHDE